MELRDIQCPLSAVGAKHAGDTGAGAVAPEHAGPIEPPHCSLLPGLSAVWTSVPPGGEGGEVHGFALGCCEGYGDGASR